jgi:hypothetical protein
MCLSVKDIIAEALGVKESKPKIFREKTEKIHEIFGVRYVDILNSLMDDEYKIHIDLGGMKRALINAEKVVEKIPQLKNLDSEKIALAIESTVEWAVKNYCSRRGYVSDGYVRTWIDKYQRIVYTRTIDINAGLYICSHPSIGEFYITLFEKHDASKPIPRRDEITRLYLITRSYERAKNRYDFLTKRGVYARRAYKVGEIEEEEEEEILETT